MKKLIVIALVFAILSGFAVYHYATTFEQNFVVKTVPVVVAAYKIPKSTMITSEMVEEKQIPVEAVHNLSIRSKKEVVGKIAKEFFEANEQILNTKIGDPKDDNESLAFTLKPEYRAISIKTDEITGVAGHIKKGDFIDIIAVMIDEADANNRLISQMVAEKVEILEVGLNSAEKTTGAYTSVTIAVPTQDLLKINYALSEGKYRLVLRSVLDDSIANIPPYTPVINITQ